MSLSLRTVFPASPLAVLPSLPTCASPFCPRPPSLWQRWWARHEGIWLEKQWYCSSDCFQAGLYGRLENLALTKPRPVARPRRVPLGLILLSQNAITETQLRAALRSQRAAGEGMLGEWLTRMGAVTGQQVINALAAQQGCPVFAAAEPQTLPPEMYWPVPLAEKYRAVPVFFNGPQKDLYVGFGTEVHYPFLYCLERMLQCRTQPCIVPLDDLRRSLERQAMEGETIVIQQRQSSVEMTLTIANYAQQVGAGRCTLACCEEHLWIRLSPASAVPVDFLFRQPASS